MEQTILIIAGLVTAGAILAVWGFAIYHRVIKNEKADLTKRDE